MALTDFEEPPDERPDAAEQAGRAEQAGEPAGLSDDAYFVSGTIQDSTRWSRFSSRWRQRRRRRASREPKHRKGLEIAGIAVILAGVFLLLFAAYLFGWSNLEATHNQRRLLSAFSGGGDTAAFAGKAPADGSPAAVLAIPSMHLKAMVIEGTTSADLQQGPGIMPSASFPGTGGEAVIAGRHLTYGGVFSNISSLKPGTPIDVTDYLGTFKYVVKRSFVVNAGQELPVVKSNLGSLALVTSHGVIPSGFYVVQAALDGNPATAPHSSPDPRTASELALGGDSNAIGSLLLWGLGLAALLALTVGAYRRTGRSVLIYVLTTPIMLPFAVFTFESAARLLPGTM